MTETRGLLSPLFTWRSAVASTNGPGDFVLIERGSDGDVERTVKASTQRHVALTLSIHMNERGGSCYPGIARIARESSLSDRAVQRALRALERASWLDVRIGEAPDGTNLYEATIPDGYEHDEGVTRGHRAYPGRLKGDPRTPKDATEDVKLSPSERERFEQIASAWREHVPPLVAHRDSYFAAPKTKTAMRGALKVYDVDAIVDAIGSYATCLGSDDYRWSYSWPLREFFSRGLDRFVPEARPLERERVRSARDARPLDHIAEI